MIRFSHLLREIAFINVLKVKYPAIIQIEMTTSKGLLKMVINPARSNTIIIAYTNIAIALKLIILKWRVYF